MAGSDLLHSEHHIWLQRLVLEPAPPAAINGGRVHVLIPVISVAAGRVFLNEPMPLIKAAGIAFVLLGLYLVNVRFK